MQKSVNFRNADLAVGGELEAILSKARAEGLSYAGIAARLFADHDVIVSAPTVGAWLRACDIIEPEAGAA